jgi:hypothetical protein
VNNTLRSSSLRYSHAARNDQLGREALHHLVSLIARQASHRHDPSVWFGSRRSNVQNLTFNLQDVTGPGRIWPIKLAASPDDTASERQAVFNQKAHGDCSRVPAARSQAGKKGAFGSLIVKVEGLRIELTGKCFDLLLVNSVGSTREALPDVEIIEIEWATVAEFHHERPQLRLLSAHETFQLFEFFRRLYVTRVASRVMSAFNSLETGQPALAALASFSNAAWSAPGILALSVR